MPYRKKKKRRKCKICISTRREDYYQDVTGLSGMMIVERKSRKVSRRKRASERESI